MTSEPTVEEIRVPNLMAAAIGALLNCDAKTPDDLVQQITFPPDMTTSQKCDWVANKLFQSGGVKCTLWFHLAPGEEVEMAKSIEGQSDVRFDAQYGISEQAMCCVVSKR